ncbi:Hpt domain-containing protein [Bdellovibrio sp. 22V]|uniref:Hpt domain-containing protein n=1 Tax=Bdellovibrio TaxID=958 RepID=UPI0025435A01|nr:Hpt domain-containing protein [Bdellovibrio sp. 22V]WII72263.1 Hpt domain-containing protein [Bdellovibrio sp. 22V]
MEAEKDLADVRSRLLSMEDFDAHAFDHLLEDTTPTTVLRILARFSQTLHESIPALEHSKDAGEVEPIWKTSHKLAGSAAMLGFKGFGEKSKKLSFQLRGSFALNLHSEELHGYMREARELSNHLDKIFSNKNTYL